MKSDCLAQAGRARSCRATLVPPSLALIFMARLAQYCWRPRSLPGLPMPALELTKHWLGVPMKLSVALLTSCRQHGEC